MSASQSLGSEVEERKQKRKLSNRESARRSRMRKHQLLQDLTSNVTQLKEENGRMLVQASALSRHHLRLEAENSVLRAEASEMTERLQLLSSVLRFVGDPGSAAEALTAASVRLAHHGGHGGGHVPVLS